MHICLRECTPRRRATAFTPASVSGLKLWLDASTGLYQTTDTSTPATSDGDPVGRWSDQSASGNHATQGTASARPTLKLAVVNGRNVVRFDGTDDVLSVPSFGLTSGLTVFWVSQLRSYSTGFPVPLVRGTINADFLFVYQQSSTNVLARYTLGDDVVELGTSDVGSTNLFVARHSGDGSPIFQFWKNGVSQGSITPPPLITTSAGWSVSPASNAITDDVCEILVYDTATSTADRQLLENYLSSRWGIS